MGKGAKVEVTKYGMSIHFGICASADALLGIYIKEKTAWEGVVSTQSSFIISKDKLFGGKLKEGGVEGVLYWLPGTSTQVVDDLIARKFGRSGGTDCPGFRGIASAAFVGPTGTPYRGFDWSKKVGSKKGFYWSANIPYLPTAWIKVRRAPVGLDADIALIARLGVDFFPFSTPAAAGYGLSTIQFTPDGNTFVVAEGGNYQVWDVATQTLINDVAFGPTNLGAFALADDGIYYLDSFAFQNIRLIAIGQTTAGSIVVDAADIPVILGALYWAGGQLFGKAAAGGQAYKLVGAVMVEVATGFRVESYFADVDGNAWGVGQNGANVSLYSFSDDVTFDIASAGAGVAYGMFNANEEILVFRDDEFLLIDPVAQTLLDSATGISALDVEPAYRNVAPGSPWIWHANTQYDAHTLLALRTVTYNDFVSVGAVQTTVYAGEINALITKPTFEDEFQFRLLDRGNYDANPAHIIYEALTNTDWGMGSPSTIIDVDSFEDAAIALAGESLGLSLIWTRQAKVQDFIQEVLDHIQGVVFVDPSTGLLTLKLVRGDYNPDTLETINPTNARISNFTRKVWGDIANEINVSWTNPENEQEETVTVQDLASIAAQGDVISDSRNYYGARTSILAQRLAQRELRSAGAPLAACEAEVSRAFWQARPASVYKIDWPEHGLSGVVFRVTDVDYGRPGDMTIQLTLLEDVYGLDIGEYILPPESLWEDPSSAPAPMEVQEAVTLPTYAVMNAGGDVSGSSYPQVLAGVFGATSDDDTLSFELWGQVADPLGNLSWEFLRECNVLGHGELVDPLDAEAASTGVTLDNFIGGVPAATGGFMFIGSAGEAGNEIALITAASSAIALSRGVLDTVPRSWPAATPVWIIDADTIYEDPTIRSAGEIVNYKLLSSTSLGLLSISAAPLLTYQLSDRPWLPSRPANLDIDGVQFNDHSTPVDQIGLPLITVNWSNRNRLFEDGQILDWTDGDVTQETGQTTTIYIYAEDGTTLLDTITGLTGTTYDVDVASFAAEPIGLIRVGSTRTDADGTFDSLQDHGIWVQLSPIASGALSASGTGGASLTGASGLGGVLSASGVCSASLVGTDASGGPVDQFETLGNSYAVVGAGAASPAGLLIPITPTQTCDISSVVFGLSASTGQSAKALVYTDSAGAPNTLIAVGSATSLGTVSTPTPFDLPFASPVTLTGGTTYWIGFVPSGSITYVDVNLSPLGSAAWSASVTYATPQSSLSGVGALGTGKPVIFVAGAFSAPLSGTDLVATSEYIFHGNTGGATWVNIPKFAVGDVVLLQLLPTNGGPPSLTTAPAGFTLVSSKNLNNVNFNGINFLYARIIDGTENGIVECKASSYNNMNARLTVWRGMDVSGTPYESVVTSFGSGTSVVSPAITTTGPDRLALNFFGAGAAANTDLTGAADAWTDAYDVNTTIGTDAAMSCTYQDAPTATTLSTETRTNAAAGSTYAVIGLALIRA